MKKYILFLAVVFAAVTAQAYDINYAGCYKSDTLKFQSVDEDNNPITLSELITYPLEKDGVTKREVGFFVLSSMPFAVREAQTATGSSPLDATILRTIATEGAMCVQLDYQGFGASSDHACKPFMNNKLNARQSIDGLFAAMEYAQTKGIAVSNDYYTINCGYSLDGGRAIAIQRYLEKYSSKEDRAKFRLRKTICGGAPINATTTLKYALSTWLNRPAFSSVMKGFMLSKAQGALHRYVEDGGIMEDSIFVVDYSGSYICADVINGTSDAGKAVWKAISQENMDEDWIPETPITYLHLAGDKMVPYENMEIALDAWGKDKLDIIDKDMTAKKWNVSMFRVLREATNRFIITDPHFAGAVNFYSGIIDGCLRDTTVTGVYGADMSFYKMLAVLFDISSNLNAEITLNLPTKDNDLDITINTLGYLKVGLEIGNLPLTITLKPEAKDSLASMTTGASGKGYLHVPVEISFLDMVTVTTPDLHQFVEALNAIMLHHKCPTEAEAMKYCNAFNNTVSIQNQIPLLSNSDIVAWYAYSDSLQTYLIEPYIRTLTDDETYRYTNINSLLTLLGSMLSEETPLDDYLTIDGKQFSVLGYLAKFKVTADETNHRGLNVEITTKDNLSTIASINLDIKGIDKNEDGTLQELEVGFSILALGNRIKVEGHCNNVSDAILAGILCYGNLSCETEAQAQAYADAVNNNIDKLNLYIQKVNDDGTYSETPEYIDYGAIHAVVAQDANGAYFVQFCFNWMGQKDVPMNAIINTLLKNII